MQPPARHTHTHTNTITQGHTHTQTQTQTSHIQHNHTRTQTNLNPDPLHSAQICWHCDIKRCSPKIVDGFWVEYQHWSKKKMKAWQYADMSMGLIWICKICLYIKGICWSTLAELSLIGLALPLRCNFCHLPHPKRFRPRPCKSATEFLVNVVRFASCANLVGQICPRLAAARNSRNQTCHENLDSYFARHDSFQYILV